MDRLFGIVILSFTMGLAACASHTQTAVPFDIPFAADSAYRYISVQAGLGERVPGGEAHRACGDWIMATMERFGAETEEQVGVMINYAGEEQPIRNIVCRVAGNKADSAYILLCAHYDCRPWSDAEPVYEDRFKPVPGANDGASGVGVIMEMARQLIRMRHDTMMARRIPNVEIVFVDCEDMGAPGHYTGSARKDDWCLGSQLWAKMYRDQTPAKRSYRYGIVLDMVGDPSATFPREYTSMQYAAPYQEMLWRSAEQLGYANYFTNQTCYPITDDHWYINTIAGIPCVDVIDYKPGSETGFPWWWHTRDDTMHNIHLQTLTAVGRTVLNTICSK